jgi:GT2 family glycosyltransferase
MGGSPVIQDINLSVHRQPLSIGFLVLNYNTWGLALRCLNAAISLESGEITEYVLFDDGSPTSPPNEIDPRIRLIRGGANRGYASALGVAFASMKSDIVVLLDSDACPLTPFAARVREQFERDGRLGLLGFMAQDQNGLPTESFYSEPNQWSLILGQQLYARLPRRAPQPSNLCAISACMATRIEAYAQVGGFDAQFGFNDVDLDYSMRLRRCGWKIAADTSIKVLHKGLGTPILQRRRVLHFYKARWYLLRKHELLWNASLVRTLILARLQLEAMILRVFGRYLFRNAEVLADKILGRQELISYCRENYR